MNFMCPNNDRLFKQDNEPCHQLFKLPRICLRSILQTSDEWCSHMFTWQESNLLDMIPLVYLHKRSHKYQRAVDSYWAGMAHHLSKLLSTTWGINALWYISYNYYMPCYLDHRILWGNGYRNITKANTVLKSVDNIHIHCHIRKMCKYMWIQYDHWYTLEKENKLAFLDVLITHI